MDNLDILSNKDLDFVKQKLKLVSAIFHQVFIFSVNDKPSKTMRNVFSFI